VAKQHWWISCIVQAVTTRKQAANKQNENNQNSEPISDSSIEPETDGMTNDNATDSLPIQDAGEPDIQIITENVEMNGNTQANVVVPDDLSTEILPTITAQDYLEDDELKNLYRLVAYNILTGNDKQDRQLLLMNERYFVEDAKLYKIALPRGKKCSARTELWNVSASPKIQIFYCYNTIVIG